MEGENASSGVRVAVIGAGAAGLASAWLLARGGYEVTLFEADSRAGGHARTVEVPVQGQNNGGGATIPIDVGFMVYNNRTYPDLVSMFELLDVEQENSSMSFACSAETASKGLFEWGSEGLAALFADRKNIVDTNMYAMLWDMRRFNTSVHQYVDYVAQNPDSDMGKMTLGEFLDDGGYTHAFINYYIIPMVAAVWSASLHDTLAFPAISLFHFFVNHGLAQVFARPQWRTPGGRSRAYVKKIVADMQKYGANVLLSTKVTRLVRSEHCVEVHAENSAEPMQFDHAVFATHPPTTLDILGDCATDDERRILGAFRYSNNLVKIHSDARLMPRNRAIWSSWNFITRKNNNNSAAHVPTTTAPSKASASTDTATTKNQAEQVPPEHRPVCVTYWINNLQNLHRYAMNVQDIFVTLNAVIPIDESKILGDLNLEHPQFTLEAVEAQKELQETLQGSNRTWFCGAYARYGFHEDAFMSGLDIAERLSGFKVRRPWVAKLPLAMCNNSRIYELPYSSSSTPAIIFWVTLLVVHIVVQRLAKGLSKISSKMIDDDPSVIVASGDGYMQRFGPGRLSHGDDVGAVQEKCNNNNKIPARITIRTPKLFARVAEGLMQGCDMAPILATSFSAYEVDAPTARDLSTALCALFVAQLRSGDAGIAEGFRGRIRLAESLLNSLVGGFKTIAPLETETGRIPELATAISGVLYPSWWRFQPGKNNEAAELGNGNTNNSSRSILRCLELIGDLSAATIDGLKADESCHATVVVVSEERGKFVKRKAQLLGIEGQVSVVHISEFLEKLENSASETSGENDNTIKRFDHVMSPAAVNTCNGVFGSMERMMSATRSLITDGGTVEFGFASYSEKPRRKRRRNHKSESDKDAAFCGDTGYRIWEDQTVMDCASRCGLALVRISQMDAQTAADEVQATIERVHANIAEKETVSEAEIRRTTAQLCLWEAALRSGYITRRVALLRPTGIE